MVDHALEIDKHNGNTLWADTIAKEMIDVRIVFKCLNSGKRAPLDYKWIKCYMIFDIKQADRAFGTDYCLRFSFVILLS